MSESEVPSLDALTAREPEFRARMWRRIVDAHEADQARQEELEVVRARQAVGGPKALALLDRFADDHDLDAFRSGLQKWATDAANGFQPFNGPSGQGFVNQIVKQAQSRPAGLATLLPSVLRAPADDPAADNLISDLVEWVESVKKGAHPAPGNVPFLCSFFWSLQDYETWPCLWKSAETMLTTLGWLSPTQDQSTRYLGYRQAVLALGDKPSDAEAALHWFETHVARVGLDPTVVDRCAVLVQLRAMLPAPPAAEPPQAEPRRRRRMSASEMLDRLSTTAGTGKTAAFEGLFVGTEVASTTARCLLGSLTLYGKALQEKVEEALGRSVKVVTPRLAGSYGGDGLRSDGWVEWRLTGPDMPPCGLTLWATEEGISLVLSPGWTMESSANPGSAKALLGRVPRGMTAFRSYNDRPERLVEGIPDDWKGGYAVGRKYLGDEALGDPAFEQKVLAVASDLQPLFDLAVRSTGGRPSTQEEPPADDPLLELVHEFRAETEYPTEKDLAQRDDRAELAEALQPDELPIIDMGLFRAIANGGRYGTPGPQSVLNTTLRDAAPAQLDQILAKIGEVLWGDGDDADRLDRLLGTEDAVKGLGESVMMKLLAICHPDRYIPVFPYVGDMGKAKLMRLVGLETPSTGLSRGQRQVAANDAIRHRLDSFFPNDPWGQVQFLYWLRARDLAPSDADIDSELDQAAADLYLDPAFLHDAVDLLKEKGQIIFYGPPGTGKTYVARELAKVLARDATRRMVVQFHPSTSYEDFFEGYRPEELDGQVTYRRTDGPLVILAERAAKAPGVDHVLVIDEINRANVPKVMGELLYLLEYRDERVRTLYRPDEAFELPKNVLVIGTMNTADRSIALVDAALRRRFHFLPFFPNDWPIEGLLARWLEGHDQPVWPAEFVDYVNDELRDDLGGRDLQIGPSYFMREGLSEPDVRRIWRYSIEPLIEDVLYGNQDRIDAYRFEQIFPAFLDRAGGLEALASSDE